MKTLFQTASLVLICLMFCSGTAMQYKFRGIKVDKVEIIIPGQLYSNYIFSRQELNTISTAINGDAELLDEIDAYHVEQSWPDPLSDFNWRIGHGSVISQFTAFRICEISEGKCLLVIPMEKNEKVNEVQLTRDIYFVMKTSAVK